MPAAAQPSPGPPSTAPAAAHPRRILVVDDDVETGAALAALLAQDGHSVDVAGSGEEALERFAVESYHLLLTDLVLPGMSGVELTRTVHDGSPSTAIILITAHATLKTAVAALRRGASDYLEKPIVPKRLRERVAGLLADRPDYIASTLLTRGRSGEVTFEGMHARSRVMHNVFEKIKLAAGADATILVTGESGTGKELVARAIHNRSPRAAGPFVAVHTGAMPRELIASELFGHERGAFTGATEKKEGKFEQADRGTIFLDEISTMDERAQINLLRVLETFTITPVGGKKERQVDARVVAATNRDLAAMIPTGEFREDLYYRLNILAIELPALRDRADDVPVLAAEMLRHYAQLYKRPVESIPLETQHLLDTYHWPGNVRELRNVIQQGVLLARGRTLEAELLPNMIHHAGAAQDMVRVPVGSSMRAAEKMIILRTLEANGGNKKTTAEVLGISRRSLYNKLAEYGVEGRRNRP